MKLTGLRNYNIRRKGTSYYEDKTNNDKNNRYFCFSWNNRNY